MFSSDSNYNEKVAYSRTHTLSHAAGLEHQEKNLTELYCMIREILGFGSTPVDEHWSKALVPKPFGHPRALVVHTRTRSDWRMTLAKHHNIDNR